MKNNRKFLTGMFIVLLVMVAACGGKNDESSTAVDDASQKDSSTESAKDSDSNENDSSHEDAEDAKDNDTNGKEETTNDESNNEGDSSTENTTSQKEEYLKKLDDMKNEMEEMREDPRDDTTFAMKEVEGNIYDMADEMLNEIYGILKEQLSAEEMEQLREEQREWLDDRDQTAKEASLEYEGGTGEQLEYVKVENDLTKDRCFELVEEYMS